MVSKPPAHRDGESASHPASRQQFSRCTQPTCASSLTARSTPATRAEEYEPVEDQPNQNNNPCGGARAPSEALGAASSPRSRRCARIRSILDARNHFQTPTAAHALLNLDPEHALQAPCRRHTSLQGRISTRTHSQCVVLIRVIVEVLVPIEAGAQGSAARGAAGNVYRLAGSEETPV